MILLLALAACGEPVELLNSSETGNETAAPPMVPATRPVRVGELGPNFQACNAVGTARHLKAGEALPVRNSPFDNAAQSESVPTGARFFVCARSLDQKWLGIVFDESGRLAERCGVSNPVAVQRDYVGPCPSGWVQSAFVKLVAGTGQPLPAVTPETPDGRSAAAEAGAGA